MLDQKWDSALCIHPKETGQFHRRSGPQLATTDQNNLQILVCNISFSLMVHILLFQVKFVISAIMTGPTIYLTLGFCELEMSLARSEKCII